MTRRPFTITPHDDGLLLRVGCRMVRLNTDEVTELAEAIAGPIVAREVARLTGLEL